MIEDRLHRTSQSWFDRDRFPLTVDGELLSHSLRRRALVLFLFFAVVFGATTSSGPRVINDVVASSSAAWNLAVNGTLDFAEVGLEDIPWGVEQPDGSVYTDRFPGAFLPAVPAYLLAPSVHRPAAGSRDVPLWPGSLTAALLVAGALAVLHEILRDELGHARALWVTLVVGLGTSVWPLAADSLWTHSVGVLVLALAMRALQRERFWIAGAWLGYAVTVRPTHAFTALGIGVVLALAQREWRRLVQIGLPASIGIALLSVYSRVLFGTWLPIAGYDADRVDSILGRAPALTGEFTFVEQITGTFFDAYHGVFFYSPFLVICALFIVPGWRRAPMWARAVTVGGVLYWIAQLRGNRFTGGFDHFGYRFPIEPLWLSTTVLSGAWFHAVRRRSLRVLGAALVAASILLNAYGAITYGTTREPNPSRFERGRGTAT